jgi:N-acetylglutamate synthase-like GNAT family acetyltransferase
MIKKATIKDFDHILALTQEFNENYYDRPLNLDKTTTMIKHLIKHGVVFVSDQGYIGGMVVPDMFRDDLALVEFGWFAKDSSGIKLLDKFIQAGKDMHVNEVRMCTMNTSPAVATRILERRGFNLIEFSHKLEL